MLRSITSLTLSIQQPMLYQDIHMFNPQKISQRVLSLWWNSIILFSATSENIIRMIIFLDWWSRIQNLIHYSSLRRDSSSLKDASISPLMTENPAKSHFMHIIMMLTITSPSKKFGNRSSWIITGLKYNAILNSISNPEPLHLLRSKQIFYSVICRISIPVSLIRAS